MINHRFPTHFAPDQDAFERLSEAGFLTACLQHGSGVPDDWTDVRGLDADELDVAYLDHLAAVGWVEEELQRSTHSPYLGRWLRHLEWGLLRYVRDVRFALLHLRVQRALVDLGEQTVRGASPADVLGL
ncbi:MAG: hypothetical protein CMB11_07145 [Euryarchaeota archaeon]|nr:hypothetical protein [Euryarchaeota archaeon]